HLASTRRATPSNGAGPVRLAVPRAMTEGIQAGVHERDERPLSPGVEEVRVRGVAAAGRERHAGAAGDRIAVDQRDSRQSDRMRCGHAPRSAYATWLWWSELSTRVPSQQLGKLTCRRRP